MIKDLTVGDEPMDRLTMLCKVMTDALEAALQAETVGTDEKFPSVRCIIMMLDDEDHGGIEMLNYENAMDGTVDLMMHLKALLNSQGKSLGVMTSQGISLLEDV